MTPEYIAFVQSRAKPGADIIATLTPEKAHLLHMAIGISGEAAEFMAAETVENEREESGDLLFYAVGATYALPSWTNRDWELIEAESIEDKYAGMSSQHAIVLAAGEFLDAIKKYTVYNKELDAKKAKAALLQVFFQLGGYWQDELPALLDENVMKLMKRYATGYSDKAAQERADKPAGE